MLADAADATVVAKQACSLMELNMYVINYKADIMINPYKLLPEPVYNKPTTIIHVL